jgi:serine protease
MFHRHPLSVALLAALATTAGAAPVHAFPSKAAQEAAEKSGQDARPADARGRRAYYIVYGESQKDAVEASVLSEGGEVRHRFSSTPMITALLPEAAVQRLSSQRSVQRIEPVPVRELYAQVVPYNIDQFQARDVWDANRDGIIDPGAPTGEGLKICVIDTGLYAAHDDFQGIAITGHSQIVGQAWTEDGNGHGTHVAGTVNAMHNDIGVVGVLPGTADLHIIKVFNNAGSWTATSDLAAAAENCVANGAQVISMSLGGGFSAAEQTVFNNLYAQGILHVAAAGNSNSGYTVSSYPANYASVVSVAAVDVNDLAASFTQHPANSQDPNNPPADGTWVAAELSGGGVNVLSTWPGPPHSNVQVFQVSAGSTEYETVHISGSGFGSHTAELVNGGLCQTGTGNAAWAGKIVLCERGLVNFSEKINEAGNRGALAAVIYNNAPGMISPGCGDPNGCTTGIPGLFIPQAAGQDLVTNHIGQPVSVAADDGACVGCTGSYNSISGTSMATPGVAAAMGFVWQACGGPTGISNQDLRFLLRDSAKDLTGVHPGNGTVYGAGYDRVTGWGLVQLKDAWELGKVRFGSTCAIGLGLSPGVQEVCSANVSSVDFGVTLDAEFTGSANLSVAGVPGGATSAFDPNPIPAGDSASVLTIGNLGAAAGGTYPITVTAVDAADPDNEAEASATLRLVAGSPASASLLSPANGASGVLISPELSWSAVAEGASYAVEIATDAGFNDIVYSANVASTTHAVAAALPSSTELFWRVTASNACGDGLASAASSFTTAAVICTAPNLAIPDNNPAGVNSDLVVPPGGNLTDLDVAVQIAHTWVGDVIVRLTHVDTGTTVDLIDRPGVPASSFGCSGDNIDAILDDGAALPVEGQCAAGTPTINGSFSPNQPLSAFNGESLAGTWRLNVSDRAGGDTGTLSAWCLLPTAPPVFQAIDDSYSVDQDDVLTVPAPGVLGNDAGTDLEISDLISDVANGSLVLAADGGFSYTPDAGFCGADGFVYEMTDGDETDEATVSIAVLCSASPPQMDDQSFAIAENSPNGSAVGTIVATDPNANPGDTLSFAVTGGSGAAAFAVHPTTGAITVSNSSLLDFETTPSFSLLVTVTDNTDLSDSATITITLNDVNEAPSIADQAFSLDENSAAGTLVGTIAASDPDAGDTLSFSVTGGSGAGVFAVDAGTGEITVLDAEALDFETTPSFTLEVEVEDVGGLSDTATVTISLNDVNEAPSIADQAFSVDENSPAGTVVGTLAASDPDAGDTLSFSVTGGSGAGVFAVDADTGEITVSNSSLLDFETTPSFTLEVEVEDAGGLSDSASITITLNDVNEAPVAGTLADQSGSEGEAFAFDASVAFSDPDGDALGFSVEGLPASLAIDADTGLISGVPVLGDAGTYAVLVTASDGEFSAEASFELQIGEAGEGIFSHGFE